MARRTRTGGQQEGANELMPNLFESASIGALELRNRFVRSATWEAMANEDGTTNSTLNSLMGTLAKNEVGLIISGHAYVTPEGQATVKQLGVHDDAMITGLRDMTTAVHDAGGHICCQLAHGGLFCSEKVTGTTPVGPSAVDADGKERGCREATEQDIRNIIQGFGQGARRAKEAGFDAVQIHAGHGYLISEFLSPFYNNRTDAWGGTRENRERLLLEIYSSIREAVGPDFPVLVKINSHDFMLGKEESYEEEDMESIVLKLQQAGLNAVELSGGTKDSGKFVPIRMGMLKPGREGYYRKLAQRLYDKLDIPLILVGGVRSYDKAETFINEGYCDFISMSRPFIREVNLIKRWKEGDTAPSSCMSENLCLKHARSGQAVYCVLKQKQAAEAKRKQSDEA